MCPRKYAYGGILYHFFFFWPLNPLKLELQAKYTKNDVSTGFKQVMAVRKDGRYAMLN